MSKICLINPEFRIPKSTNSDNIFIDHYLEIGFVFVFIALFLMNFVH
jgi:hypothetical protein